MYEFAGSQDAPVFAGQAVGQDLPCADTMKISFQHPHGHCFFKNGFACHIADDEFFVEVIFTTGEIEDRFS